MKYFDNFILTLFSHRYKMRGSTLLHLFNGKRTASVLLYGYFYNGLPFFGLFPELTASKLAKTFQKLTELKYLTLHEEQYSITPSGFEKVRTLNILTEYSQINGFIYGRIDDAFYQMILFATQIVSNLGHAETDYLPIESRHLQRYLVKKWLATQPYTKTELIQEMYTEWANFLQKISKYQASWFVAQLSGYHKNGRTIEQLIEQETGESLASYFVQKNLVHFLLSSCINEPKHYSLFHSLYKTIPISAKNQSAELSYQAFLSGQSITEIQQLRALKEGTIVDHLIESFLLHEEFPAERLIQEKSRLFLMEYEKTHKNRREWTYQQIKANFPAIDYASFRFYQLQEKRKEQLRGH